jgi:thioredoxin 1
MSGQSGNVLHPSLDTFEAEVMSSELPTLVDFWAPWCPPCLMLKPELERLAPKLVGRANVAFVNVDEHPGLAEAFRVSGIPALFVLKGGRVVDAWTGGTSRAGRLWAGFRRTWGALGLSGVGGR